MPAPGNCFLFLSGDIGYAVALEQLKHLLDPMGMEIGKNRDGDGFRKVEIEGRLIPLVDPRLHFHGKEGLEKPVALAVVEERGLTAALLIDRIIGIREEPAIKYHAFPDRLFPFVQAFNGIIEVEEGIFLLLKVSRIIEEGSSIPEGS